MAESSFLCHQFKYDVFLSFRGQDIKKNFVDHLHTALVQSGIRTFNEEEPKVASESLLKAIDESRSVIVVLSKSYSSSAWCLDELVKIMECSNEIGQLVLPVYYDINRSDLRKGLVFGQLLAKHDMDKVRAWRSALVEVANLSGLDLIDRRHEAKLIKQIVETVSSRLDFNTSNFNRNAKRTKHEKIGGTTSSHGDLVGIERRMQELKEAVLEVETVKIASRPVLASSPPSFRWIYDVFMSFRVNETCKDFADKLYRSLNRKGIYTFRDDQRIVKDDPIAPEVLRVIEESSTAVVIFSKNYATDSRCLDELVKIMSCNEKIGQTVLPVFYDVDSSDVRNQKGFFGQALMRHKPEKVEIWKKALGKACSLAGWYLNCTPKSDYSHEVTIIRSIVDMISRRLIRLPSSVDNNLIGIENRVNHLMSLLEFESGGVCMFGIWGMGGIGKTTIARAVFDRASNHFDGSCFVENIREVSKTRGLKHIQEEILSELLMEDNLHMESVHENLVLHHKVLIVLDDVDDERQLEALAGARNWFGEGSRIIITTRDEHVLLAHNITQIYCVVALDDEDSIQFLRKHAFKKDDHIKGYEDLLCQVVRYAGGLPLALKVVSRLLRGKSKKEWISTLARLAEVPEMAIQDTLKISFDGLADDIKNIFLDIACFFNGEEKEKVVRILDGCGFSADIGIRLLEQKSLISIVEERIQMHHLLEQMGREIVCRMHPDEPGKRSRLWHSEEVSDVLTEKLGTKEINAIVIDNVQNQDVDMTDAFKRMECLKLLQIRSDKKSSLLKGSSYLPKELRWLAWKNYPLRSLPTSFEANHLVGLELIGSGITELWSGVKFLGKLRFLDLSRSTQLIETPDFIGLPNLEKLKLEYCTRLEKVHKSIGSLNNLTVLSLRSCRSLATLPTSIIQLKSLRALNLSGCSNLHLSRVMGNRLPFPSEGRMIKLLSPFGNLVSLVELDFSAYKLEMLDDAIYNLKQLRTTSFGEVNLNAKHSILGSLKTLQNGTLGLTSDDSLVSETETSSESNEQNRGRLPLSPYN